MTKQEELEKRIEALEQQLQQQLDDEQQFQQSLKAMPRPGKQARTKGILAWLKRNTCSEYPAIIRVQGFILAALAGFVAYVIAVGFLHVLLAMLIGVAAVPLAMPPACKWLRSKQKGQSKGKRKGGKGQ